jgi:cullin-4
MPSISRPSNVRQETPTSPDSRKRKRAQQQQREASPNRPQKQHTLPSVLAAKQRQQTASPTSKRSKQSPATSPSRTTPLPKQLGTNDMYNFSSTRQSGNTTIDLTASSPPTTPQSRRINGSLSRPQARGGVNAATGAKKLVVKNLKTNTQWDSKAYLEKIWGQLDAALALIFKDVHDGFSKEDLYRGVENVCRQGGASTLYTRLDNRCRQHVELDMRDMLVQRAGTAHVDVLSAVMAEWARWKAQMVVIRSIYFFLDRSYLLSSSKTSLTDLTPKLFREIVFNHGSLKPHIVEGACDLVATERQQQSGADQDLFKRAVDMFHELTVYTASFEPRFLGHSQEFVDHWSTETSSQKSVPEYVALADECIKKEMDRCDDFALSPSTRRDLLSLLEQHMIVRRKAYLTDSKALAPLLDENAAADLTALYSLLARRRLGSELRPAFETWIEQTGTSIVFAKDSEDMVVHILSLKRRLDALWKTAFQRDEELGRCLRESFETFMNKTKKGDSTWGTDNSKVGEMIAKYVDQLLRGGAKAIPELLTAKRNSVSEGVALPNAVDEENAGDEEVDEDAEVNIQLDQVLDLFRFVHGKAVFEAFYKKDLARRLLMGRSASADAERSMLSRLKTECGSGFTMNLEQMFKDVELSREEMQSYKQRLEERDGYTKGKNIELNVNILSAAAWPTYPDIPIVIPANVKKSIDDFELHYKSKHSGRKLDWKHALAHCQMRATFGKVTKELVVSSFQAVVLLLFNTVPDGEHLTYSHILTETGLRKSIFQSTPSHTHSRVTNNKSSHSRTRSQTHPPIPRLRQTPAPNQTPQIQRHPSHRHLHLQPGLHAP